MQYKVKFKKLSKGVLLISILSILVACQPKHNQNAGEAQTENIEKTTTQQQTSPTVPLLESKTVKFPVPENKVCDESGCTLFSFQTVETNQAWINDYFVERMKTADPTAFQRQKNVKEAPKSDDKNLSQNTIVVRYLGQNEHLATFEMTSYVYTAGAAHGMYHHEYINFDLKNKKRIALQDLIVSGTDQKIRDVLFEMNRTWLEDHNITKEKLDLSDNFYYGANGIVFVYPLYELASYAEGMSELVLPYQETRGLIKPEYLPNLPNYDEAF